MVKTIRWGFVVSGGEGDHMSNFVDMEHGYSYCKMLFLLIELRKNILAIETLRILIWICACCWDYKQIPAFFTVALTKLLSWFYSQSVSFMLDACQHGVGTWDLS